MMPLVPSKMVMKTLSDFSAFEHYLILCVNIWSRTGVR